MLVLGAGMAGLVAARILHDTGFPVQVLEARSRLGGRIWTSWDLGRPVDMGASWIHGIHGNPLTRWCHKQGIPIRSFPKGGTRLLEKGKAKPLSRIAWRGRRGLLRCLLRSLALLRFKQNTRKNPKGGNPHLSDLFDPLLKSPSIPLLDKRMLLWFRTLEEAINGAPAHMVALSELEIPNYGWANAIPLSGYGALINDAAQGLPIILGCPVRKIMLDTNSVHVETTKGIFQGDAALVTFPVGVLRSRDLVFDPPLPSYKHRALDSIGYGSNAVLNKTAIRFAEPMCPAVWERLGWLPELGGLGLSFALWTNMHSILGAPIMVGYTSGEKAASMDCNWSDKDMVQEALGTLGRMFDKNLSETTAWKASRWLSDPWSRGSYSFENGEWRGARLALSQPIADRIYFAGEATHPKHYGTVHGALLSGEQAAANIHELYCCRSKRSPGTPWN